MSELFSLEGRVAVVTGGSGALGSAMAEGLAAAGARLALLARRADPLRAAAERSDGLALEADVLCADALAAARDEVLERYGRIDILVNAAGGNLESATKDVFDVPAGAFREVLDLNLTGTLLPSQVFGAVMPPGGSIVNVSSMAAQRALTRVGGYGAAKAGVESLTRWLAVELAGAGVRVNAIAPGFFVGNQNRRLLVREDGTPTERGCAIIDGTPARRFGTPDELIGTLVWLCGRGASFVNGVVVNVDGGFGAFSGV